MARMPSDPVEKGRADRVRSSQSPRRGAVRARIAAASESLDCLDRAAPEALAQHLGTLSNVEVAVLALFGCGGDHEAVDTEDVAIRANALAPGRFGWKKYPEQISLEHVRVVLSDAKKVRHGRLVSGTGTEGWRLTADGAAWATKRAPLLGSAAAKRQRSDTATVHRRALERARVQDLPAWRSYLAGSSIEDRDAEVVFRINSYTPLNRRQELIERLRILFLEEDEVSSFLMLMAEKATASIRGSND